jgi:predicted enzyme related to lactoylglutathione lyase
MFEKVAFTMCPVRDLARACGFYESTLGLTRSSGTVESGWVEYDLPSGGCLAITRHAQTEPSAAAGATAAFEVADLAALIADLKSKNVEFKAENIESPVCRMAVCVASEGNGLLLHQLKSK